MNILARRREPPGCRCLGMVRQSGLVVIGFGVLQRTSLRPDDRAFEASITQLRSRGLPSLFEWRCGRRCREPVVTGATSDEHI